MARRRRIRHEILKALAAKGDAFGLELVDRIHEATNGTVFLLEGRIYPALRALEAEGLLESYQGEPLASRGNRPRTYYRLTGSGHTAVARLLTEAAGATLQEARQS